MPTKAEIVAICQTHQPDVDTDALMAMLKVDLIKAEEAMRLYARLIDGEWTADINALSEQTRLMEAGYLFGENEDGTEFMKDQIWYTRAEALMTLGA